MHAHKKVAEIQSEKKRIKENETNCEYKFTKPKIYINGVTKLRQGKRKKTKTFFHCVNVSKNT